MLWLSGRGRADRTPHRRRRRQPHAARRRRLASGTATPTTARATTTGSTLTVPPAGRATPSWLSPRRLDVVVTFGAVDDAHERLVALVDVRPPRRSRHRSKQSRASRKRLWPTRRRRPSTCRHCTASAIRRGWSTTLMSDSSPLWTSDLRGGVGIDRDDTVGVLLFVFGKPSRSYGKGSSSSPSSGTATPTTARATTTGSTLTVPPAGRCETATRASLGPQVGRSEYSPSS
jgi:hypothetical protein